MSALMTSVSSRSPLPTEGGIPLGAALRGAPLILLTALLGAGAAIGLSLAQKDKFRATAEAIVSSDTASTTVGNAPQLSSDPQRIVATQAKIARLPEVAELALRDAAVDQPADAFLTDSSVVPDETADVLEFVVNNPDPATARTLADAYVAAYIEYRGRSESASARKARLAIEERIDELEGQLAENDLADLVDRAERLRGQELARKSGSVPGAPAGPAQQVQPQPLRNGLLGGVLGAIIGVGLLFARNSLSTKVRSIPEVESNLDMPLLGRIPTPSRSSGRFQVTSLEDPLAADSEPYRMLATSIEVANLEHAATSFMVASAVPGEGKSTTAANLAVAFAGRGEDVILLEADLRRPVLRRFFSLDSGPGLSDVAVGRVSAEEALVTVPLGDEGLSHGRLRILASAPSPLPPDELLQSEEAHEVIRTLCNEADVLIIDSPPMLQVSDARTLILSEFIDCVLLAVRLGRVRRPELLEVRRLLDGAPVLPLGFFATGVGGEEDYAGAYNYRQTSSFRTRDKGA